MTIKGRFTELATMIPIPYPWDLAAYVDAVADHRGRPITLRAVDMSGLAGTGCGTGTGLWIARRDEDLIVYDAGTSEWHIEHIILHEIGHMLFGHTRSQGEDGEVFGPTIATLLPSISPESISQVLGRDDYGTVREREAETFADMVMVQAMLPRRTESVIRRTFFRGKGQR